MTKEQTKELLPLITAFAEGKTIQLQTPTDKIWVDIEDPSFTSDPSCYRIKPEPREFWICPFCWAVNTTNDPCHNPDKYPLIHVREVKS